MNHTLLYEIVKENTRYLMHETLILCQKLLMAATGASVWQIRHERSYPKGDHHGEVIEVHYRVDHEEECISNILRKTQAKGKPNTHS